MSQAGATAAAAAAAVSAGAGAGAGGAGSGGGGGSGSVNTSAGTLKELALKTIVLQSKKALTAAAVERADAILPVRASLSRSLCRSVGRSVNDDDDASRSTRTRRLDDDDGWLI